MECQTLWSKNNNWLLLSMFNVQKVTGIWKLMWDCYLGEHSLVELKLCDVQSRLGKEDSFVVEKCIVLSVLNFLMQVLEPVVSGNVWRGTRKDIYWKLKLNAFDGRQYVLRFWCALATEGRMGDVRTNNFIQVFAIHIPWLEEGRLDIKRFG